MPSRRDRSRARDEMVDRQIVARGIGEPALWQALRTVPRERFVPAALAAQAHDDAPLPIGEGQTISQPCVVASMLAAARLASAARVLEVGAGSGYVAALLAHLVPTVCALERLAPLVDQARERLQALGLQRVDLRLGDGSAGWPGGGVFDAIVVSAAGPAAPQALLRQLAPGGRLVMPIGDRERQDLVCLRRRDDGGLDREVFGAVRFVPLLGAGAGAWSDDAHD